MICRSCFTRKTPAVQGSPSTTRCSPRARRAASASPNRCLFKDHSGASLDKVKHGIHDLCALVLAYLRLCLLGDFGWVAHYDRVRTGDWP